MESIYVIESQIAVLFLSITLCIYMRIIYSASVSSQRAFLNYCCTVSVYVVVEILVTIILSKDSSWSIEAKRNISLIAQIVLNCVYYMYSRYIGSFGAENSFKKNLFYAQKIMFGVFWYLELVSLFTGTNITISPDRTHLEYGILNPLLEFWTIWFWSAWTWFEQYAFRKYFTRGQQWALISNYVAYFLITLIVSAFLPGFSVNYVLLVVNLYYFFFLLETPAYSDLEKTLNRLRKAKDLADEANEIALAADAAKGEFLANMSHEIRTPLTTILGMDELIIRKYDQGPIYEYARDIQSAGNTLLHIINEILDFSKIETGQLDLSLKNYDLSRVLRDVDNMIRIRAEQKGLEYIQQIDDSLPSELFGDNIRVHQIMVNILNNGVKYTKHGSVKFTLTGERTDDPSLIILHITVTDTGIGIHEEDIPKLFKSFSRIDAKETHKIEGTGLGLAITGRLIELMGGRVDVNSTYGMGTTFHVILPQRIVGKKTLKEAEADNSHVKKSKRKIFTAPTARILIVDDNDMNRVVLRALMKETKVQVDEADSGEACLSKIQENAYDVILMDYMMPRMDGKETLSRLRAMKNAPGSNAKVIVCTANAIVGVRAELLAAGFDDFLSKPVNGKELEEMLRKYIPSEKISDSNAG